MIDSMRFIFISPTAGNATRARKLFNVCRDLSDFLGGENAITTLGDPFFSNDISEAGIGKYLAHVESQMHKGIAEAVRFSDKSGHVNFFFNTEPGDTPYDYIWFSYHAVRRRFAGLDALAELTKRIYASFEAGYAFTEDFLLMEAYFSKSVYATALKQVPEQLQVYIPKPDANNLARFDLPSLPTSPRSYPWKMPKGIWWMNCLNKEQIESLGRQALLSFDWYMITPLDDAAILFVLTEAPLDIERKEHLEKLKRILDQLSFTEKQQQ